MWRMRRKDEATPWDAGTMQPALQELVESSELDLPKSGRALVPGCGRVGLAYNSCNVRLYVDRSRDRYPNRDMMPFS